MSKISQNKNYDLVSDAEEFSLLTSEHKNGIYYASCLYTENSGDILEIKIEHRTSTQSRDDAAQQIVAWASSKFNSEFRIVERKG